MFTGEEKQEWAYRCLMRPPVPGAIPREGLDRVDYREGNTLSGHYYYGTVTYTRKLADWEIRHYDLEEIALVVVD